MHCIDRGGVDAKKSFHKWVVVGATASPNNLVGDKNQRLLAPRSRKIEKKGSRWALLMICPKHRPLLSFSAATVCKVCKSLQKFANQMSMRDRLVWQLALIWSAISLCAISLDPYNPYKYASFSHFFLFGDFLGLMSTVKWITIPVNHSSPYSSQFFVYSWLRGFSRNGSVCNVSLPNSQFSTIKKSHCYTLTWLGT